jgi:hypothetical protein
VIFSYVTNCNQTFSESGTDSKIERGKVNLCGTGRVIWMCDGCDKVECMKYAKFCSRTPNEMQEQSNGNEVIVYLLAKFL